MSHNMLLTPPLQSAHLTPHPSTYVPACRGHVVLFMELFLSHRADHVVWPVAWCQLGVPLVAS